MILSRVLEALMACRPEPARPEPPDAPALPEEPAAPQPDGFVLQALGERLHETLPTLVYARWTQSAPASARVEYRFDAQPWRSSPLQQRGEGEQEALLLGIPFETEVTWRVVAETEDGPVISAERSIVTGEHPPTLPRAQLLASDSARFDPEMQYVLLSISALGEPDSAPWWSVIVDREGRAVWALRSPQERVTRHTRLSDDGSALLIDFNSFWSTFDASDSEVVKLRIDGSLVHRYATPGLHHPFVELPDQSIAWGAYRGWYQEQLRIVGTDGSERVLWDCESWLAERGVAENCASNTLSYHPDTNTFLFSLFSVETIVEIDGETGQPLRWFGHLNGSYAFDPPQSAFFWQHGGYLTETGTLLVSSDLTAEGVETIVREYEVDAEAETLREVWNFGIGDGIYGRVRGEAHRLGNGNTLHNTGEVPRLREASPEGEVVWDLLWEDGEIGRSAPVGDLYDLAP